MQTTTDAPAQPASNGAQAKRPKLRKVSRGELVEGVRNALRASISPDRYAEIRSVARLATRREVRPRVAVGVERWAWRAGFRSNHVKLYDLYNADVSEYVSDFVRIFRCLNINPVPELFNNKLLLHDVLHARGFATPQVMAVVEKHGVTIDPLGPGRRRATLAEFARHLLEEGGRFIVKPHDGTFGAGVSLLERQDGRLVVRRGTTTRPFVAERDLAPVRLVERAVEQGEFWSTLSPVSTNTLRVVTMWTPGDAAPFIGRAVQRMGTSATMPTDNWSGGGICALVDLSTGRLGIGRTNPEKTGATETRFTHHPESGALIEGAQIPGWDVIADTALRAAAALPFARYVGWDVAVDRAGTPVFIEGNNNTDVNLLQVHGGLLADARVRRFYEACGVLDIRSRKPTNPRPRR